MNLLSTYPQKAQHEKKNSTNLPGQGTLHDTIMDWIECRKELNELKNKLFSLCKNDRELHWLKSRGKVTFPKI